MCVCMYVYVCMCICMYLDTAYCENLSHIFLIVDWWVYEIEYTIKLISEGRNEGNRKTG